MFDINAVVDTQYDAEFFILKPLDTVCGRHNPVRTDQCTTTKITLVLIVFYQGLYYSALYQSMDSNRTISYYKVNVSLLWHVFGQDFMHAHTHTQSLSQTSTYNIHMIWEWSTHIANYTHTCHGHL